MAVEYRRMYQRRGLSKDLPSSPTDGEIYVTLDTKNVFMGIGGNLHKMVTSSDIVDSLTSASTMPLSANQGRLLNNKIEEIKSGLSMVWDEWNI